MTYPTYDTTIDTRWRKPGDNWAAGYHPGVDFEVPKGSRVSAPAPSTIVFAGRYGVGSWGGRAFGNHVVGETILNGIRYRWIVAHLSAVHVKKGQHVAAGQLVGASGNTGNVTGPHVHLEVRDRQFKYGQDVDPQIVLSYKPGPIDKMDPANYGTGHVGPHVTWAGERLVAHGFGRHYKQGPGPVWGPADEANTRDFQLAQGWTGDDADGQMGRETLKRLAAEPKLRIDWRCWKLTLPTGKPRNPTEIRYPRLVTYTDANVRRPNGLLELTAAVDGVTTSGSGYPRCEFREMDPRTGKEIGWDSRKGSHHMTVVGAATHLPGRKPEIVVAQIHDKKDDVVMVRLEGDEMIVEANGKRIGVLDPHYKLGERYTIDIDADKAGITILFTKGFLRRAVGHKVTGSGWYFKAGTYTQANRSNGTGFGQAHIEQLDVEHLAAA
jgi:hypothetical protein